MKGREWTMELHNDQKQTKGNVDPFTQLMFGENRRGNRKEESPIESNHDQPERSDAPQWDSWLFGNRPNHSQDQIHTHNNNPIENYLNQIDIGLLMETVDEAIKTYKLYQPLFKDVTPFFKKFLKKS